MQKKGGLLHKELDGLFQQMAGSPRTELAGEEQSASAAYRTSGRRPYPCVQWVAPYDGETFPTQGSFCEVRCFDISTGGISFFTPRKLSSKLLVVKLAGAGGSTTYLAAKVMHYYPGDAADKHRYRVGCRFVQRLYFPGT